MLYGVGIVCALATSSTVYFGRYAIASFYPDIPKIHEAMVKTFELVAFVEILSSCQTWQQGLPKGLGHFNLANLSLLLSFYGLGVPWSLILAFKFDMGIWGLWTGMLCGLISVNTCFAFLSWRYYDWPKIIEECKDRS